MDYILLRCKDCRSRFMTMGEARPRQCDACRLFRQWAGHSPPPSKSPSTSDPVYSPNQLEFLLAMQSYKDQGRPWPSWQEVLAVVHSLGYRKVEPAVALPVFKRQRRQARQARQAEASNVDYEIVPTQAAMDEVA